ncbi:glycosyltransferase family 2 protein [Peribacillus frigoritolerans]|uniref:glycosyltransferase family 2 protein n=1 Tax=Peribacillus frigoritolerans TaxID=450367 RepID=UPI003DA34C3E
MVVENVSTYGTLQYLDSFLNTTFISNRINRGFSRECNQGLSIANGENIVLLNNDTVVTVGWLTRLL